MTWRSAIVFLGVIGLWVAFLATGSWALLAAALALYVGGNILARRNRYRAACEASEQAGESQSR